MTAEETNRKWQCWVCATATPAQRCAALLAVMDEEDAMVYVDNAAIPYTSKVPGSTRRPMKMNHMVADTHEELVAMAQKINVQVKWIQNPGTIREHFDICSSKRHLAIQHGAGEVNQRELAEIFKRKREEARRGSLRLLG